MSAPTSYVHREGDLENLPASRAELQRPFPLRVTFSHSQKTGADLHNESEQTKPPNVKRISKRGPNMATLLPLLVSSLEQVHEFRDRRTETERLIKPTCQILSRGRGLRTDTDMKSVIM